MPVFRYMQYQHFLDWVRTGLYRISNICKWEDPYENYLLKCPLLDRFGLRISKIVLPDNVGQRSQSPMLCGAYTQRLAEDRPMIP